MQQKTPILFCVLNFYFKKSHVTCSFANPTKIFVTKYQRKMVRMSFGYTEKNMY